MYSIRSHKLQKQIPMVLLLYVQKYLKKSLEMSDCTPFFNCQDRVPTQHIMNDWLKSIPNNTPIPMLSIPGTHDSATYTCGKRRCCQMCFISQCQIWSIYDQLQLGIRYLDLRVYMEKDRPVLKHGPATFATFEEVVRQVSCFLREQPHQFVIMAFQGDVPDTNILKRIMDQQKLLPHYSYECPTVGQLRGKAWMLSGFGVKFVDPYTYEFLGISGFHQTEVVYCQNEFIINNECPLEKKCNVVVQTAYDNNCSEKKLKVNFLSAGGQSSLKGIIFGPFPYQIARDINGPNCKLFNELSRRPKAHLGITVMDYPGNELIKAIIKSNYFSYK